jgi:hypothetical protein
VAARCGAEVVFTEVRVEGRRLVATIAVPAASSARAIITDFISFVRECTQHFSRKGAKAQRKDAALLCAFAPLREKHRR